MIKRPITTIFFASLSFLATLTYGALNNEHLQASLFNKPITALSGVYFDPVDRIDPEAYGVEEGTNLEDNTVLGKYGEWSYCDMHMPETPEYIVDLQEVNVEEGIEPGTVFTVNMTFINDSNVRLYSLDSGCYGVPTLSVGTTNALDRNSIFGSDELKVTGWAQANRIAMTENYADPGETFHVMYQSIAPAGDNLYREFYQPVVEGVAWIGESFGVDIPVGTPTASMEDNMKFVTDLSIDAASLEGLERNLEIDLSTQMMYAKFGDIAVWDMQISSGHRRTPTPPGNYKILLKQELRIGGAAPHYRMPYFQMWRAAGGYGIHALPYLADDGGTFWSEALGHIGTPVSHGCIRTLPDDALTVYQFTTIGTPVWIH